MLVADEWQGHGLGTELLHLLVRIARDEELNRLVATILSDNRAMQNLARHAKFAVRSDSETHDFHAELKL